MKNLFRTIPVIIYNSRKFIQRANIQGFIPFNLHSLLKAYYLYYKISEVHK